MDVYYTLPPVSRTITAAALIASVGVHAGFIPFYYVAFIPQLLWKIPPDIWRPFSSFLITGAGWGLIFDLYFLYKYSSALETESPRFSRPGDFPTYIAFCWVVILATAGYFMNGIIFMSALELAFAYTYSQDNPYRKTTFYIVTIQTRFLPYVLLLMTLVMGGQYAAMRQATGLIAAHLYDFLTRIWPTYGGGRNYIQTPEFVARMFGSQARSQRNRGYGVAYAPGNRAREDTPAGRTTGWTSNFGMGSSWGRRGPGRRLGGD
ncbi:Der1-like family-domain-containing protein [Lineolata rhizophorae]|uniref:Derlin n=1 Tax=Lineolata rhizophorae TaxID=578093 RepID=A0A6A6NZ57_9PEZI|nr:Der1-like family-domain-containing protein [Lineolata rhizophorae]